MPRSPRFSVIIPAFNEEELLPRLLASLARAAHPFPGPGPAVEVIVADNGSTDATAAIARSRGCKVVTVDQRVIGAVRNGGARVAVGEILCFIDADSVVHPATFAEIAAVLAAGDCAVGASGVRMERRSPGIGATYLLLAMLTRLFAFDTGMVFCRRVDFAAVGGYRENLLCAEDVDFMWRLKRLGGKRGARFRRLPRARAITSTRKFDRHGDWHYFPMLVRLSVFGLFWRAGARGRIWDYWYTGR